MVGTGTVAVSTASTAEVDIGEVVREICLNESVTMAEITKRTRVRKILDIRKAIVLIGDRYCHVSNKHLAQMLNLSPSMISKIKSGTSGVTDYTEKIIKVGRW